MARLATLCLALREAIGLSLTSPQEPAVLDLLLMADIGHSRDHSKRLTDPWPMGKCAEEGSFSLYEGLRDYVGRQGARPTAVIIVGDVAYGGGDAGACNDTRADFQKFLNGLVPVDRVFPAIGNHDVHYLGCSVGEIISEHCYYGSARKITKSIHQMSFEQWRVNWMTAFPGLRTSALAPPEVISNAHDRGAMSRASSWLAPSRYNLNLDPRSSVYFIIGLVAGVHQAHWNTDTAPSAVDGTYPDSGPATECRFLKESLAYGRSLGKTIFIYLTHDFDRRACADWSLIQQVDIWVVGHKHNYWQNQDSNVTLEQERRYFPARLLIGNGGFDEAHIDVVSFVHFREVPYEDKGVARVKLHFDVLDTCVSNEKCPSTIVPEMGHCWERCKSFPGGFDGGGGPRKATPSLHGFGFVFDAPQASPELVPSFAPPPFPGAGPWKLLLGNGTAARWLMVKDCLVPTDKMKNSGSWSAACLVPTDKMTNAAAFALYDGAPVSRGGGLELAAGGFTARLALDDEERGPVVFEKDWFFRAKGFWDIDANGVGLMKPSAGWPFTFVSTPEGGWGARGLAWHTLTGFGFHLGLGKEDEFLPVSFHRIEQEEFEYVV